MKRGTPRPKQLKWDDIPALRKKLFNKQKGICPICKRYIKLPVLDHHHIRRVKGTGQIRGVLCSSCNVMLGKIENNCTRYCISKEELPEVLKDMAKYLTKKQEPYLHPSEAPKIPKLMKSSYNQLAKVVKEDGRYKMPEYPKSGKLTVRLAELFIKFDLEAQFYS